MAPAQQPSQTLCAMGHVVPIVLLAGAQKAGTTSLHADILRSVKGARPAHSLPDEPRFFSKEQHFFGEPSRYAMGAERYLRHFVECPKQRTPPVFAMDSTPYLQTPRAAADASATFFKLRAHKAVRIIVILRSPTERARSWFDHFNKQSPMGVNAWVNESLRRMSSCAEAHNISMASGRLWRSPCLKLGGRDDDQARFEDALSGGMYAPQLEAWLSAFGPSQLALTTFDGYLHQTERVLVDLAHFLGHVAQLGQSRGHSHRGPGGKGSHRRRLRLEAGLGLVDAPVGAGADAVADAPADGAASPSEAARGRALVHAAHLNIQARAPSVLGAAERAALDEFYRPHVRALIELLHKPRNKGIRSTPFRPASALTATMLMRA